MALKPGSCNHNFIISVANAATLVLADPRRLPPLQKSPGRARDLPIPMLTGRLLLKTTPCFRCAISRAPAVAASTTISGTRVQGHNSRVICDRAGLEFSVRLRTLHFLPPLAHGHYHAPQRYVTQGAHPSDTSPRRRLEIRCNDCYTKDPLHSRPF